MSRFCPALISLSALALAACASEHRPSGFAATLPPAPQPEFAGVQPATGAIFQASHGYAPLHTGMRAAKVGDLVTVVLTERTQASNSTRSTTNREGSISITPPSVGPFSFNPGALNSGGGQSFNGQGNAAQTSTMRGDITVTIAEVLPGGMARIRGEKLMHFAHGEEWIQLSGLVRLVDIDPDNRIASTRIGDAHIRYGGRGSVQRASRPGWLSQFFSMVSPF